jgi:outer membrane protein
MIFVLTIQNCNFESRMKKIHLTILSLFCFVAASQAQMAFVDSKFILKKMPDYADSLAKLNQLGVIWQKEIDDKQAILDRMYRDFERDEAMLSDSVKKFRTDDIFYHEKEVRDLQRLRFGFEGDLFKKKQELIKPLEDKINATIKAIAAKQGYGIVLDRSEGITVMYSKSTLDITEEVERELGLIK